MALAFTQEPPRRREVVVTIGVFLAVFGVLSLWPWPLIHPSVWEELTVAAGLRPPSMPFPGIYRGILSLMAKLAGWGGTLKLLPWLGHALIALAATWFYLVFRDVLPTVLGLKSHLGPLGARIGRLVALVAAILFISGDPIWRAGQCFSPVTLTIALVMASVYFFFRFVRYGKLWPLFVSVMIIGVVSAECTAGLVLSLVEVVAVLVAVTKARSGTSSFFNPIADDLVRAVTFKRLTYVWVLAFITVVLYNAWWFVAAGGMEAMELHGVLGMLFAYFKGGWDATSAAASGPGWLFALLMGVVPFLLALQLLPRAWDDDKFLPYVVGVIFVVVGLVAVSQLSFLPKLWFWTWLRDRPMVPSDTVLALVLILDAAAVTFALAVFGVDACCRNYKRIAQQRFPESMQFDLPRQIADSLGRARAWRRRIFWGTLAITPLAVLPSRYLGVEREMMAVMAEFAEETLRELGERTVIFTDGSYDCLLETLANGRGKRLTALSLMSTLDARQRMVRQRAAKDEEDSALLENDAAGALRTWVSATPEKLDNAGVQIGFEVWKRSNLMPPPLSGLMALPGATNAADKAEMARALADCKALGNRAYAVADKGKADGSTDSAVKSMFPFVLWRLSRIAQLRSQEADKAGNRVLAYREAATADELDSVNSSVQALKQRMEWMRRQGSSGTLTPREGLVIGLARADFAFAGRYAAPVLRTDPDDTRANFAMGMMYYNEEKYSRAEEPLLRCLVRRPDEPAVHNNLAIVQMKLGKLDDAEEHVRLALKRLPDSVETKKTLEKILKLKEEKLKKEKAQ